MRFTAQHLLSPATRSSVPAETHVSSTSTQQRSGSLRSVKRKTRLRSTRGFRFCRRGQCIRLSKLWRETSRQTDYQYQMIWSGHGR
ncbi:unnamed protein product, partial [Mycena citricolor]